MYKIDKKDKVIEIEDMAQSSIGSPCPVVVAGEHDVLLAYYLETFNENWDGTNVRIVGTDSENEKIAIVNFENCTAHLFGPPNDEAFTGHPLSKKGLKPYSVFLIENSSWIRKYERINSVHPLHNKEKYLKDKKHFIFSFHDSIFECIAKNYKVEIKEITMREALEIMVKLIR